MYATQYEALRSQMLGETPCLRGIGLAALLQSGLAGWLRAVGSCVSADSLGAVSANRSPAPAPADPSAMAHPVMTGLMPSTHYTEAARLIANLVLSAHPGPEALRASPPGGSR